MSGFSSGWDQVLEGTISRVRSPQVQGAQEGFVIDVTGTTATFKLSETAKFAFGSASFDRNLSPQAGDRCLIIFVGNGVDKPWIVAVADAS